MNIWTKRDDERKWRKLHTEKIHILYSSFNVLRMVELRKTLTDEALLGNRYTQTTFWMKNLKGQCHSRDLVVDGRIILNWILHK